DVVQLHAQHLHLVAVDIEIDRRIGCGKRAEHARELRLLVGSDGEAAQRLCERLWVAAAQILQHVGETAAGTETDNGRRREWNDGAALNLAELRAEAGDQLGGAQRAPLSLLERLERHYDEARVRLRVVVDEVEADDGSDVRDGFLLTQDVLGLADRLRR